ncbi:MAG: glycosyltransferase family 9 protein [Candidatus Cloacimonetes bacterium]|nr:glycosyltransferase family 9 protein [Candidatus Cloacimonadota bacterium]MBS3766818.1 glycosyltransferase family 9 protein [Candidatus Cloacimonadota bacterium]
MSITKKPDPSSVKKILVIQLGPFGDVFLTTSYFEHLKKHFHKAQLSYMTKKKYKIIVENHPYIDNYILLKEEQGMNYYLERLRKIKEIRAENFDIVIDQQNKNSTRLFTLFSGAKWKVGYEDARCSWVYNVKAKRGPEIYNPYKRFDMIKPLGIEPDSYQLYYSVSRDSENYIKKWLSEKQIGKFFVLSPGSPIEWKKWNIKNYARLADLIVRNYELTPIWLWGPDEKKDAETGAKLMEEDSFVAPPTTLNQAAALLKRAELFICNDGGINHLAVTTGVKTIALFGATDPHVWSPASEFENHHHMYNPKHNSKEDNSFGYTPEEVLKQVKNIL